MIATLNPSRKLTPAVISVTNQKQKAISGLISQLWREMADHNLINVEISPPFLETLTYHCPEEDFCGQNWLEVLKKVLTDIAQITNPNLSSHPLPDEPLHSLRLIHYCPQQQLEIYLFSKMALEHIEQQGISPLFEDKSPH